MFFDPDAEPDAIDDMGMVRSACLAIARLMDTVEELASERADLTSRLRQAIIRNSLNDWPGKDCAMPSVLDFLLAIAEETETSKSLAARLRTPLRKSVFGYGLDDETDYDIDEEG